MNTLRVAQLRELPLGEILGESFGYRYAYARSADSQANNDLGQDYLEIQADEHHLVFAVCDGVSQSFFGDLAARYLGEALVRWAWTQTAEATASLQASLEVLLHELTKTVTSQVAVQTLPTQVSPLVQDVLEQKRRLGSESTFVVGKLDLMRDALMLGWMGDTRIRLWGKAGEMAGLFAGKQETAERWSSLRGPLGQVHVLLLPLNQVEYGVVYTDGLARLDRGLSGHAGRQAIEQAMSLSLQAAESDDMTFFEFWFGPQPPTETSLVLTPITPPAVVQAAPPVRPIPTSEATESPRPTTARQSSPAASPVLSPAANRQSPSPVTQVRPAGGLITAVVAGLIIVCLLVVVAALSLPRRLTGNQSTSTPTHSQSLPVVITQPGQSSRQPHPVETRRLPTAIPTTRPTRPSQSLPAWTAVPTSTPDLPPLQTDSPLATLLTLPPAIQDTLSAQRLVYGCAVEGGEIKLAPAPDAPKLRLGFLLPGDCRVFDARDANGEWLRVAIEQDGGAGWFPRRKLLVEGADALPVFP